MRARAPARGPRRTPPRIALARRAPPRIAVACALALAAAPAAGQAPDDDPLFTGRDAAVAGAFLAGTGAALAVDRAVAGAFQSPALRDVPGLPAAAWTLDRLAVPGAFVISAGLWGAGRLGGDAQLADVGLHMGESLVVATAATFVLKVLTGRARPAVDLQRPFDFGPGRGLRGVEYRSFPSGHAAIAFAAAAAAATELDRTWPGNDVAVGLLTYGPATLVGLARVFENRHWASDVVFGAAIGVFAGWKTVEYVHDHPGNTLDRWFLGASVTPGHGGVRLFVFPAP